MGMTQRDIEQSTLIEANANIMSAIIIGVVTGKVVTTIAISELETIEE